MAASQVVVKFLGDTRKLTQSIDGIKKDSAGIGGGFARGTAALKGMALPALGAATAVFTLANKAGEAADRLLDLEQITGVSTDKLQEMENVAKVAGTEAEFYANSVNEVVKAMDRIERGTGPAAEALEKMHVATSNADGSMRSAEAITDDVIAGLLGIEDASLRASLAEDIFKRKGQELIPVLALGADGMMDARNAAHELGIVQSTESLTAANDYRIAMEDLQTQMQAVSADLINDLIPVMTDQLIPALEWVVGVLDRQEQGWRNLTNLVTGKMGDFDKVKANIRDVGDEMKEWGRKGYEGTKVFTDSVDKAKTSVKALSDEVRKATDPAFALRKAQEDFAAALKKVDDARKGTPEHTQALLDEQEAQADLNYATDKFEEVAGTAIDYMYDLGFQAGQTRLEIEGAVEALTLWNQTELAPKTFVVGAGGSGFDDIDELDFIRRIQGGLGVYNSSARRPAGGVS